MTIFLLILGLLAAVGGYYVAWRIPDWEMLQLIFLIVAAMGTFIVFASAGVLWLGF